MKTLLNAKFKVTRDPERCIQCKVCCNQCSFDVHYYDAESDEVLSREENCVGCHRCATFCPAHALTISRNPMDYRENQNWRPEIIEDIFKQAETGGMAQPVMDSVDRVGTQTCRCNELPWLLFCGL